MALISAAYRGVDVRILVPDRSDVRLTTAAGRAYCRVMVRSGVRVYRYLPSMLHAKTLLVDDDIAIVGSANADMRSFRLNFELGALIHDRGFAIELEKKFRADILESREMTRAMATRTTLLPRLRDNLVRLLSAFL
jgi:cardiolipin synthase